MLARPNSKRVAMIICWSITRTGKISCFKKTVAAAVILLQSWLNSLFYSKCRQETQQCYKVLYNGVTNQ